MTGQECKFVKYMEGSDKRFVIPVYQRNYDWKIENCKQLYDDLVKIIVEKRRSHFFGSIVSKYNQDSNGEYLIIDGQQRLTTVSLLFLAMYNLLDKGILVAAADNLKQRIYDEYLVDKYQPKEKRLKLKPVKHDRMAFDKLFADSSEYIRDSHLTVNYNYFYERIQKEEISRHVYCCRSGTHNQHGAVYSRRTHHERYHRCKLFRGWPNGNLLSGCGLCGRKLLG